MSLYKRNNVWWVGFTSPSGKRIRKSTGTTEKQAAQEFHDTLKAQYWKVEKLGEKPTYLWNDAVIKPLQGVHEEFVFTYLGKPVWQVNTKAWRKALKTVGIEDFRWHGLRHTWASWHVQAGTPLHVLQELGGWESTEMIQRYAHLDARQLAKHAANISLFGTNLTHPENNPSENSA